jgi:hypothetical protein
LLLRPIAFGALACALALPALAQQTLSAGDKSVANFAFATQLGSGIYTIDGRTVQIYRLPLDYVVKKETDKRWGLRVTFPLTIGFYDFKPIDVVDTGVPDSLDTLSLVPGLEFRVPVGNVLLKPFLEAGVAREGASDTSAWVYSGGLRIFTAFKSGTFDVDLGNGFIYARVDPEGEVDVDDFSLYAIAAQARHSMGVGLWNHELEYGLYTSIELYNDVPNFPLPADGGLSINDQYEFGATIGPREPWKIWKIKLPKIGIGYRMANDGNAVRFVIGGPVAILKR